MTVLYIGQFTKGTTSRMRAQEIQCILKPSVFDVIDTNIPFFETHKIIRSLGFQYKKGPLISKVNSYIKNQIPHTNYDLIWIDKGIYMEVSTMKMLKEKTKKLVHYTPDMAFYANKSKYLEHSLPYYDYCISTKTAESKFYLNLIPKQKLLMTTQGYSEKIHKPFHRFEDKDDAVVFIGLAEAHRFEIAKHLLKADLQLKLVGKKWQGFVNRHQRFQHLNYLGETIYDEAYSALISSSKFSLGFLSKQFPEYHTTRTFEILACGTALLTEANPETMAFFDDDEVIFYKNPGELIEKITYYIDHDDELEKLINKGREKVVKSGYDYQNILANVLQKVLR